MKQPYVIYYLCRKGFKTKDIKVELDEVYQDGALSLSQVYFWKREFLLGREDVEDEHRSGRPPDDGLDAAILCMLKDNPHATAHKMARKFGVDPNTITRHLNNYIGMGWLHLRYVPHKLSSDQKEKRVELSKKILKMLEHSRKDSFQFTLTGDESWIEYEYSSTNVWAFCKDDCDDIERPNKFTKKILITVFINGKGLVFLNVKPQKVKLNGDYFIHNVLEEIERNEIVERAKKCKKKVHIHFDNAPSHNCAAIIEYFTHSLMSRVPHPPYSPDLAPCDFGLFGTIHDEFKDCSFETENELIEAVIIFFESKSSDFWKKIFSLGLTA